MQIGNASNQGSRKIVIALGDVSATTTSAAVDLANLFGTKKVADSLLEITVMHKDRSGAGTFAWALHQSTDDGVADAYAANTDLIAQEAADDGGASGALVAVATTTAAAVNKRFIVDPARLKERYIKLVATITSTISASMFAEIRAIPKYNN